MKSFLRGLVKGGAFIGRALTNPYVSAGIAAFAPGILPGLTIANQILGPMVEIEAQYASAGKEGGGSEKKAFVVGSFAADIDRQNSMLAMFGKKITYDKNKLEDYIDAKTKEMNSLADLQETMKLEDL